MTPVQRSLLPVVRCYISGIFIYICTSIYINVCVFIQIHMEIWVYVYMYKLCIWLLYIFVGVIKPKFQYTYTAVEFYEKIIKDKKFKDAKNRRVEQVMHIGNRLWILLNASRRIHI
jgi:hypothetical protein